MLACDPRVSAQHFRPLPSPLLPLFTPLLPSGQDSRSFSAKSGLPARKKGGGEGPGGGCCLRPASQSQAPPLCHRGRTSLVALSLSFEGWFRVARQVSCLFLHLSCGSEGTTPSLGIK